MRSRNFVFVFCMFFLLSSIVQACVSYPLVESKNGCSIQFTKEEYRNSTSVMKKLNDMKSDCGLSDTDIFTLNFFVINGYSVKQQNKNEYKTFLKNAENANSDRPNDCLAYEAVFNKNDWTGYIESGKEYKEEECIQEKCVGAVVNLLWNDLRVKSNIIDSNVTDNGSDSEDTESGGFNYLYIVIPIIVIIALFVIFRLMVSGDREEESAIETSKPIEQEEKAEEKNEAENEWEKEEEKAEEEKPSENKHYEKRREEKKARVEEVIKDSEESEEEKEESEEEKEESEEEKEESEEEKEDEYGLV